MYKKLLTRTLIAVLIAVLGYFAFISSDVSTAVPIMKADRQASVLSPEAVEGESVQYKSFDADGNEIVSGSSQKLTKTDESRISLEDGLELEIKMEGKDYLVVADRYGLDELDQQVLTADPGKEIVLRVDDMVIETPGPMILDKDGVFQTEASARFRMGDAHGRSVGLRYKPDVFLELARNCIFTSETDEQQVQIDADFVLFQNNIRKGLIRNGKVTSQAVANEAETTTLTAGEIELHYMGGRKDEKFRIIQTTVSGGPARFSWARGELIASSFDACFDQGGQWVEELITSADAWFTAETQDDYRFNGRGGSLSLIMNRAEPAELIGRDVVEIEGTREDGIVSLTGQKGLETLFSEGRAVSTRIFGEPTFKHQGQHGVAGNLRLFHKEHNIIFSEGAELWDEAQQVRIKADQILLTDWDKPEKEVNAFKFVTITYNEDTSGYAQCFGDELKFLLPGRFMELKGRPAKVNRKNLTIDARRIELEQIDDELFDLTADAEANSQVELFMVTDEGVSEIQAKKIRYRGRDDLLEMENVLEAILPGRGRLSCKALQVQLMERADKKLIETIKAFDNVIFEGTIAGEDGDRAVRCQADELLYEEEQGLIHFLGKGQDVVFRDPEGVLRGRELTYSLKDGSIRGDSDRHGTTVTTINIKGKNPKKKN